MKGYWRNEKATSEIITKEGWLKTGDLVREDADHQLFVVSRLKELIKVNAFQVAPTELEEIIIKLDGVADCAVIGIPNKESGELPRAFIVKRKGADISGKPFIGFVWIFRECRESSKKTGFFYSALFAGFVAI
jgi:acyl-CoA synthetase (AMP-forming)/AMP-acid ligase II